MEIEMIFESPRRTGSLPAMGAPVGSLPRGPLIMTLVHMVRQTVAVHKTDVTLLTGEFP
jgi:hypothetical protein